MKAHEFSIESRLRESADNLWTQVTQMRGVNWELAPLVYMTAATRWKNQPLATWPLNRRVFRSLILLFRIIPVDVHSFRLAAMEKFRFEEDSTSWMNASWKHTRTLIPKSDGGCVVRDEIRYASRIPFMGRLYLPVYRFVFANRHRWLRRRYGLGKPK